MFVVYTYEERYPETRKQFFSGLIKQFFEKKKEEKEGDETILFENRIFLFERERREKKHTWMFGKILFP